MSGPEGEPWAVDWRVRVRQNWSYYDARYPQSGTVKGAPGVFDVRLFIPAVISSSGFAFYWAGGNPIPAHYCEIICRHEWKYDWSAGHYICLGDCGDERSMEDQARREL